MPLTDLARALPGVVLVGLVPGLLLATLLAPRWRWWERLAMAPGLAAGVAGLTGAAMHTLHVPFSAATVAPVVAALAALAVVRLRRAVPRGEGAATARRSPVALVAAALLAGGASVTMLCLGLGDGAVPPQTDAPVHAQMANAIASTHDALPRIPEPVTGTAWVRPRMGVEAEAALVSQLGGPAPAAALMPLTVLAVLLLPLSLAMLTLEATRSWTQATLAPLLGVGMIFPLMPVSLGEYPLVVDSTLIAAGVVAVVRALRSDAVRDAALLLAGIAASIWVVHGLEAISAAVVGGPLCLAVVVAERRRDRWRGALLAAAGVAAGTVLAVALLRTPAVPPPRLSPLSGPLLAQVDGFVRIAPGLGPADVLRALLQVTLPGVAATALLVCGVVAALVTRRLRWAVAVSVLLGLAFADVLTVGLLSRVWVLVFPWAGTDRLASLQYWVMPPLMALGVVWLAETLRARLPATRPGRAASATGLAAAVLVTGCVAVGALHERDGYRDAAAHDTYASAADLTVARTLARSLPPGATVLTDGLDDGGQWLGALTDLRMFFSKGYLADHPLDTRIAALSETCRGVLPDPALFTGVDAVYVGSVKRDHGSPLWHAPCLDRVPWLRPVAAAGGTDGAAAWTVDHAAASSRR